MLVSVAHGVERIAPVRSEAGHETGPRARPACNRGSGCHAFEWVRADEQSEQEEAAQARTGNQRTALAGC